MIDLIALNMASTGPSPVASLVTWAPSTSSVTVARCGPPVPAMTVSATSWIVSLGLRHLVLDQRHDVLVEDVLLAVGEILEAAEGVLEGVVAELEAERDQLLAEGVAAGMLAHHQRGRLHPDVLGPHDLVGLGVLEHAVLVDAGLVGEGVLADDRLVVLDREGGDRRHQLRGAHQERRVDVGVEGQHVGAGPDRHHDLLERGVAGALAEAVDRALDLPRPADDAAERVGDRQPEVVVAVGREDHLVGVRHALEEHPDQRRGTRPAWHSRRCRGC